MSINKISRFISSRIAEELLLSTERQAVIEFGLINLLSQFMTIILLLVISYFLGIVREVIVIGFCSAALRRYSGGAHCSSPLRCSILSIIIIPILVLLAEYISGLHPLLYLTIVLVFNFISIIIYFVYAPKDSPAKPIRNLEKIKKLKFKSVFLSVLIFLACTVLLYFNYVLIPILMTLGSFNQCLTLTKIGKSYIDFSDKLLKIATP